MKKIILLFGIFAFSLSGISSGSTRGPQSAPYVDGPRSGPPSRAEINKLKYTKDPDFIGKKKASKTEEQKSFFQWLLETIYSLF